MKGVQPCERASSPVSSNILRFSQPTTPLPPTPLEVHSVWLASSAKIRWCVGKHVLISVNFPVFGSYMERCRVARSIGKIFAEGWLDPFLQKSGFSNGRTRAVNHTRPCSSIIGLCRLVWLSQIGCGPQCTEGCSGSALEECVSGSRTGCLTCVAVCVIGSRTGK